MADIDVMEANAEPIQTRAKRLKQRTALAHERLDRRIMSADPFASRERYALFAKVQYEFHRDIAALYTDHTLARLVPDLRLRQRLELIAQDLVDIGAPVLPYDGAPHFSGEFAADIPTALGWLYVAEGSNLGAAFLLKEAAKIGLSESFGARHLASAPEGRGADWRSFVTALDDVQLSEIEEQRVISGAEAAFLRVHVLVEQYLPV
jgi:heme oxygenase (biliverdin-IX-beta and delta-forming)